MKKTLITALSFAVVTASYANDLPSLADVVSTIHKVNRHWQKSHPDHGRAFWDNAAYHTGNMEAYFLTGEPDYLAYSEAWAKHNDWVGAKSDDKASWRGDTYGEGDNFVLFGDWQICFQTYADLYNIKPANYKIARAREVMEYEMSTPRNDYWWWADGLYMVMPVMTKMYKLTQNSDYLGKLYEYWEYANSIMLDQDTGLYFRDGKYVYPDHKSVNGNKDFWARGNGWVLAAFAKVLKDLPEDDAYRQQYTDAYLKMAEAVAQCQQPDGYWTRSLLDPEHAPGPETSGTAFFTYGLLWGINNGLLDEVTYMPVVEKAWNYLTETALQPDGSVGYVQPIGEKAIPGQVVNSGSTANFGVGAFLLAACEMARYIGNQDRKVTAYGQIYPKRYDDLAWENDLVAFRAYGPALSKDNLYGYDIFLKRNSSEPVLPKMYEDFFNGISYHEDHGYGLDCYAVGPTLGAGATAIVDKNGSLVYPGCYQKCNILVNGPKLFMASLIYDPVVIDGDTIVEQRLIMLQSGSNLNSTSIIYHGATKPLKIAVGIALHDDSPVIIDKGNRYMAYIEPTQGPDNGQVYIGGAFPSGMDSIEKVSQDGVDQLLAYTTYYPHVPFTYYWGYGWNRANVSDMDAWIDILTQVSADNQK